MIESITTKCRRIHEFIMLFSKRFKTIYLNFRLLLTLSGSKCMDETTCFPLAFGVPAVFMILAVISFVLASKWYVKIPPLGNPITDYSKVIWVNSLFKIFN